MVGHLFPGVESRFPARIRNSGFDYAIEEKYSDFKFTPYVISATVHGQRDYATRIVIVRNRRVWRMIMSCSCPYLAKDRSPCKHLYALLLVACEHIESGKCELHPDELPLKVSAEVAAHSTEVAISPPAAPAPPPPPSWSKVVRGDPFTSDSGESMRQTRILRDLRYVVDLEQSRIEQGLVLTVRRPFINNHQRAEQALKLTHQDVACMPESADRVICGLLMGATNRQLTGHQYQYYMPQTAGRVHQWRVAPEMFDTLLPMLSASGRFFSSRGTDQPAIPLSMDESRSRDPWRMSLHIAQDAADPLIHRLECRFDHGSRSIKLAPGAFIAGSAPSVVIDDGVLRFINMARARRTFDGLNSSPIAPQVRLDEFENLSRAINNENLGIELTWDDSFGIRTRGDVEPIKFLSLRAPSKSSNQLRLGADLNFHYDGEIIPTGLKGRRIWASRPGASAPEFILRKPETEAAAKLRLEALGFSHTNFDPPFSIDRDAVSGAVSALLAEGWTVLGKDLAQRRPGDIKIKVTSNIDWFCLKGHVEFDSQTIDVTDLLAAIRRGERTVQLGDGTTGTLPEEWVRKHCSWLTLGEQAKADDGSSEVRFASTQACIIDLLLEQLPDAEFDKAVAAARRRISGFSRVEPRPQPTGFNGELRDYQTHGLGWLEFLKDFGFGGILADDMGLGKTVQLLAHIKDCRDRDRRKDQKPWLIVAPKSLVFNWAREAQRFTPSLQVVEYTGSQRHDLSGSLSKADIVLTTYGALRTDATQLHEQRWDAVVLDEAQAIKNASSIGAKAARLVGASAARRIALTGTPIENSLADLWSIMEFLNPGMLGTAAAFKEVSRFSPQTSDQTESNLIRRAVKPFILRRTKQVVAKELPERTEQTVRCELAGEQKVLYESILKHYRESLLGAKGKITKGGVAKNQFHVLEALLRLRQAACHPGLIEPKDLPQAGSKVPAKSKTTSKAASKATTKRSSKSVAAPEAASSKISTMLDMLDEILAERHSVIIFSQFTSLLAIVRSALNQRGIAHEYLDGQTELKERAKAVDRFQKADESGPRVFVISLKAGGVGLNLTAADYVFILDPWWNPAAEAQAIDRAHRIGQTRKVMAYRFITAGTVEDRIQELQATKRALATAIMGDDAPADGPLASLTKDELTWLLS